MLASLKKVGKRIRPMMETETSPLLHPTAPATPPPPYSDIRGDLNRLVDEEAATSGAVDFYHSTDDDPGSKFVRCEVCQFRIDKKLKKNQKVITCPRCNESTALGPAEDGKKFLRCPECNCLLIANLKTSRTICPRKSCQTTIDTRTGKPVNGSQRDGDMEGALTESINQPPQYRIICGYCHGTFVQDTLPPNNQIMCPLCHKKSHIGEGYVRKWAVFYICVGLGCIIICVGLMATTMGLRHNAGYWYIYLILMILSIGFIVKGLWCLCMKHSQLQLTGPIVV